jgi:hypothetical protein
MLIAACTELQQRNIQRVDVDLMLPSLAAQKGPIISRPPALSAENLQKVEN